MAGWKIGLWVGIVAVVVFFLYLVRGILLPFLLGFLFAILLDPIVRRLRTRGMKRGSAVMLVFSVFFVVLIGVTALAAPVITRQIAGFTHGIATLTSNLAEQSRANNYFLRWNPRQRVVASTQVGPVDRLIAPHTPTLQRFGLPTNQREIVEQYIEPRRVEITNAVRGFFTSLGGVLTGVGAQLLLLPLAPFVALFLLFDFDRLKIAAPNWIPPNIRKQTVDVIGDVGEVFLKYLRGLMISLTLYTTLLAIVLSVVGAPYAVLLAIIFGCLYLIPVLGAPLGYVTLFTITGLSGLTSNGTFLAMPNSWAFAGAVTLAMILSSESYDKMVHPNLVGHAVGLSPLVSMFVVFAGATLFGVVGMILAFPLGGAIKVILERLMRVTTATGSETLGLPAVPLRHGGSES